MQRPRSRPAEIAAVEAVPVAAEPEVAPMPPKPAREQLPSYHEPIAADALPTPDHPRDRRSDNMILVGGLTFSTGVLLSVVGGALWYQNSLWRVPFDEGRVSHEWEPDPKPAIIGGIGIASTVLGATLLGVGVARHKRWKKGSLETARVRLQPVVGFGQIGVVGRF